MTTASGSNFGCLLVGEYVDEAEVPSDPACHCGEVVRPQVVAAYQDLWSPDGTIKEFTVLLKDSSVVTVHGHGLTLVETPTNGSAISYGVKMAVGAAEVLVALFPVVEVMGIFSGERKLAGKGNLS